MKLIILTDKFPQDSFKDNEDNSLVMWMGEIEKSYRERSNRGSDNEDKWEWLKYVDGVKQFFINQYYWLEKHNGQYGQTAVLRELRRLKAFIEKEEEGGADNSVYLRLRDGHYRRSDNLPISNLSIEPSDSYVGFIFGTYIHFLV